MKDFLRHTDAITIDLLDICFTGAVATPDLNADPVLYPVQKSVKEHNSLASYFALVMTKYGHRYANNIFRK